MAHFIESHSSSPLAQLRQDLAEVEKLLVKVNSGHVVRALELLDLCSESMYQLRQQGVDLKGEEGLWAGFEHKLHESAGQFVKASKPHGGLASLRASHSGSTGFWWHLDDTFRSQNRRQVNKVLRWGGLVAGVIAAIYILLTYVFPPDEITVLVTSVVYDLESLVEAQDYKSALKLIEENLDAAKRSEELLIWAGILEEQLGNTEATIGYFDEAGILEEQLGNTEATIGYFDEAFGNPDLPPVRVWATIGTDRLRIGDFEGAECSAQAALELEPEFPQGHFLIASVAEATGNFARAVEYFNLTADYAYEKEPQMAVIARVRLGYLMQSPTILGVEIEEQEFECTYPRGSQ